MWAQPDCDDTCPRLKDGEVGNFDNSNTLDKSFLQLIVDEKTTT